VIDVRVRRMSGALGFAGEGSRRVVTMRHHITRSYHQTVVTTVELGFRLSGDVTVGYREEAQGEGASLMVGCYWSRGGSAKKEERRQRLDL
jgi:hypothetical protein